jgi:SAM-dependent methyltransferase
MLLAAGRGGVRDLVGGGMPDLPFLDGVFDAVVSAFVITHVDDPDAAARDMHRVLRSGGRAVLSAWSRSDDEYSQAWSQVVHEFVGPDVLAEAAGRVLPGEPRFSRSGGLAELLAENGFAFVQTVTRSFSFALTVDQMIETREVCASGRALRMLLSDAEWKSCRERLRTVLGKKFPGGIHHDREVYFAVGRRS